MPLRLPTIIRPERTTTVEPRAKSAKRATVLLDEIKQRKFSERTHDIPQETEPTPWTNLAIPTLDPINEDSDIERSQRGGVTNI